MAINSSYDENDQVQLSRTPVTMQKLISTGSTSNAASKNNNMTAYVTNDRVQLLSHLTEKTGDKKFTSSFQLAANIYKSNSDEFKLKKKLGKNSNKKSVLTLPNKPSILPQICTVSDINDSNYCERNDKPKAPKPKKRLRLQKKTPPTKEYEFYDRDADYCSEMNIYLDCSSTAIVKNFKGDCRKRTNDYYNSRNHDDNDSVAPHDVWAVLRNINRFQFQPSPPMSDEISLVTPRKKKAVKKKVKKGVYETCRTEQIAYISSIELNVKSPRNGSLSNCSSIVTVIDNKNGINQLCEQVQKTFGKNVPRIKSKNKGDKPMKAKPNNKKTRNDNALCYTNRSSECKTINDQTDVIQTETNKANNDNVSKETLVEQKSVITLKSNNTSKKNDFGAVLCGGDSCTEVEIRTELGKKEGANKSRINSRVNVPNGIVGNVGALGDANHQITNIHGRNDARVPFRRPLETRGSWYNSNTQARPILPPKRLSISGPTKIVPGSPKSSWTLSRLEECPRIPLHQATTIADTDPVPQCMCASDIRKHIAKMKFPLVILGRDEVRGNFKVDNYDYPQFNGLDEHVWPFMLDWKNETRKSLELEAKDGSYLDRSSNNQRPAHTLNKQIFKGKKPILTDADRNKCNKKETVPKNNLENKNGGKLKPILQFRDKMLKLLYKKASDQNIVVNNLACIQGEVINEKPVQYRSNLQNLNPRVCNTVDVGTSSISIVPLKKPRSPNRPVKTLIRPGLTSLPPPTSPSKILLPPKREKKLSWSKAIWASDMIENVIKKIKNGTYYTKDLQTKSAGKSLQTNTSNTNAPSHQQVKVADSNEVSVQVTLPIITGDFTPKITIQKKKDPLVTLPGFDDFLPPLEIKSITRNQIAVKHCVTNVLLQFDVNVPLESDQTVATFKRSTSCIPLTVTESKTKIFKCKARILNAILPAELCSIIPKVMKQFLDKNEHLFLTLQEENKLSGITASAKNISLCPITESVAPEIHEMIKIPLLPRIEIRLHPELRKLRDGRFSKNPKSRTGKSDPNENIYIIALNELPYKYHSLERGLLLRPSVNAQEYVVAILDHPMSLDSPKFKSPMKSILQNTETNLCTDLVPYFGNAMACGECHNAYNMPQILTQFWKAIQQGTTNSTPKCSLFPSIQLQIYNNQVSVSVKVGYQNGLDAPICTNMFSLNLGPLYQAATRCSQKAISNFHRPEKRIEYIKRADKKDFGKTTRQKSLTNVVSKYKRMGHVRYVKLYKKCKSTSHIAAERSSTLLSKVTNLDEFFQALGAGKLLSSAFDGSCGKKILSCISELKKWITGITPRQALLVMLLTNKKDTWNLVRFRPVILQGIAVNRITRVDELDMEIEVIERESFNKLPAYPGLPSILESTQNNDSLFEELCWIAKTTASDYQKRFDESSVKLLKTLLEKRKKLNPSYLRVMARYVGLGLLKTPAKST